MKVEVKNLPEFLYPLKALKSSINSVIFSIDKKKLIINTKSLDGSQFVNIKWNPSIVSIPAKMEKFGIYDLTQFITTLELFGGETVTGEIDENKFKIRYGANEQVEVKYNLSDINLIPEGAAGPKAKIDYVLSLKLDSEFLKKIKAIAASLSIGFLQIEAEDGNVRYQVSSKDFQSHIVKEDLCKAKVEDFSVCLNIEKLAIIPEGKPLVININSQITEFVVEDKNYDVLRYFIAPISMD